MSGRNPPSYCTLTCFVLFRFRLLYDFIEATALRSIVLRSSICRRPYSHTCFFLFSFCFFGDVAFSEYFGTIAVFSLYGDYSTTVRRTFSLSDDVFLPCDHGLDFFTMSLCDDSINQSELRFYRLLLLLITVLIVVVDDFSHIQRSVLAT